MSKELTDAQKITRLRSNLATRAAHTIKNKYIDEYQEVYYSLLEEYGLAPSTKVIGLGAVLVLLVVHEFDNP